MHMMLNEFETKDGMCRKESGISGSTLKMIAIITMLIDHIGAVVLGAKLLETGVDRQGALYFTYWGMRLVGRIAFPIFCFLLVEGFMHTRSRLKYGRNLLLFALVSEIPFNLAISWSLGDTQLTYGVLYPGYQNVFFTLLIGLLCMCGYDAAERLAKGYQRICADMAILVLGMLLADVMHTDYSSTGVLAITLMYAFREKPVKRMLAGCIALTAMNISECTSFIALFPAKKYNGKRGLTMKYIFYAFYPVHLFLLYLLSRYLLTHAETFI